jgi:hypothetical protein
MKRVFIQSVAIQPFKDDPSKGTKLEKIRYNIEGMNFVNLEGELSKETTSPMIPVMEEILEVGDDVQVLLLMKVPEERAKESEKITPISPNIEANRDTVLEELKEVFVAKDINAEIVVIEIPEKENNANMLMIFNDLRDRIEEDTLLSCDVTFGNKSMAILLFNLIRYCNQKKDNFILEYFIYGERDWSKSPEKIGAIYDETFEFFIDDVITASLVSGDEALDVALRKVTAERSLYSETSKLG